MLFVVLDYLWGYCMCILLCVIKLMKVDLLCGVLGGDVLVGGGVFFVWV